MPTHSHREDINRPLTCEIGQPPVQRTGCQRMFKDVDHFERKRSPRRATTCTGSNEQLRHYYTVTL